MWNLFSKLITAVLPPDATDERVQRAWRNSVGWTLTGLLAFVAFVSLAMTTGVPGLIGQLVWADDVLGRVEQTTKPAVQQIQELGKKVENIERKVDTTNSSVNAFLAQAKAAEIRAVKLKRCVATASDERDSLNREIDRLQFEYRQLTGERYESPACAEL